jgi:hypothetical protein
MIPTHNEYIGGCRVKDPCTKSLSNRWKWKVSCTLCFNFRERVKHCTSHISSKSVKQFCRWNLQIERQHIYTNIGWSFSPPNSSTEKSFVFEKGRIITEVLQRYLPENWRLWREAVLHTLLPYIGINTVRLWSIYNSVTVCRQASITL